MKRCTDKHHLIPRSRGGLHATENLQRVSTKWHRAYHRLLGNLLPHESALLIMDWHSDVIEKPSLEELEEIIRDKIRYVIETSGKGFSGVKP